MKDTRPLDNNKIGLFFGVVLLWLFIGCGGDTLKPDAARFIEVKPPRVRGGANRNTWHADFDVVFEGVPIDMKAEFKYQLELAPRYRTVKGTNWEQTGNIVTLRFEFRLVSIEYRNSPTADPVGTLIFPREHQKQSVEVTLTWTDGRKTFTVAASPPKSLFVGRSDILSFER